MSLKRPNSSYIVHFFVFPFSCIKNIRICNSNLNRASNSWGICNETKALEGYKDELKPKFKSTPTQFQTVIFASSDTQNVGDHDGDMSETKLAERQQKILNLIKESPTITGKQMSETLSVSQRTIERDLSALQKHGVLKREGKDNDGKWVIISVSH